jgi:hypothetical protein
LPFICHSAAQRRNLLLYCRAIAGAIAIAVAVALAVAFCCHPSPKAEDLLLSLLCPCFFPVVFLLFLPRLCF